LSRFLANFQIEKKPDLPFPITGAFGYMTYEAVEFFEDIPLKNVEIAEKTIPTVRYAVFQYVIIFDHFRDEVIIAETTVAGKRGQSEIRNPKPEIEQIINSRAIPSYDFKAHGEVVSNLQDLDYQRLVQKGIEHCQRGDVFQIVLSRRFSRRFSGDEFNVYRALRSINPSPYLFYFDYGNYKLFGSSPESILVVEKNEAILHPIAGTFRRTGNEAADRKLALKLKKDPKELSEHVMLVDLARNDLSKHSKNVKVARFQEVHYYSHLIHLVSEVRGKLPKNADSVRILADVFPAGTLSGAPKHKAMTLINEYEKEARSFYGGCIGFFGFDGTVNQAIMIRTFLSKNNTLTCQAGAGVVVSSVPEKELAEVNTKLAALNRAVEMAQNL
jgi:anthranilate synthase component I